MESPFRPPNILRLVGISPGDWVPPEDVADAKLLEGARLDRPSGDPAEAPLESDLPRDKIPRVFTGLAFWPRHTNLACWQCDFTFDNPPRFVSPAIREGENGGIESDVLGNFCTHNCAELWTNIHYAGNREQRQRISENNRLIYFIFTGVVVTQISPAPSKTELRKYGGTWDEEAFGRRLREIDPLGGLHSHTPGSIVPERSRVPEEQRAGLARSELLHERTSARSVSGAPVPRVLGGIPGYSAGVLQVSRLSLWSVCGMADTAVSDGAPLDIASFLAPAETLANYPANAARYQTVKPTTVPVVKPATVPVVKPATVPVVKPATVPVVKPATAPAVKPAPKPASKAAVVAPAAATVAAPAVKVAAPATKVAAPATKVAAPAAAKPATAPSAKPVTTSSAKPATAPSTRSATAPPAALLAKPAAASSAKPAAASSAKTAAVPPTMPTAVPPTKPATPAKLTASPVKTSTDGHTKGAPKPAAARAGASLAGGQVSRAELPTPDPPEPPAGADADFEALLEEFCL